MKSIFPFLFLSILSLTFLHCSRKSPAAADYFERYFHYQEAINREIPEEEVRSIIYGSPESEEHLYQKDDSYFLSLRLTGNGNHFQKELSGTQYPINSQSQYSVFVEAKKAEFRTKNTYKVKRKVEMISPEVSVFDIFPIIEDSVANLRKIDLSHLEKNSELQKFLCSNFECAIKREEGTGTLFFSYTLSERMKDRFPNSYKKFAKRLDQAAFRFQLFQPGSFSKGWEFYNEGRKIVLGIPISPPGYWSRPKTLHLRSYFFLNILGLKIDIRGLGYTFQFSRSGNTDIVSGEFTKLPETQISGRFLSVFPISMVNMFVPEDMDQYAEDSFELLVKGSDGKGGNSFQTRTIRNGNKTKVILTSDSEIFRDRFLPFKSKDKDDDPAFFLELEKALVADLRGK